jgi:hypothetical protein
MFQPRIPPEYDARLLGWSNGGMSVRDIAAQLTAEGIEASPATVARRLQSLRNPEPSLARLEADIWRNLEVNIGDFDALELRLSAIEDLAYNGDPSKGIRPDLGIAARAVVRQMELLLNKHKFLQTALDRGLVREARRGPPRPGPSGPPAPEGPASGGGHDGSMPDGAAAETPPPSAEVASVSPVSVPPETDRSQSDFQAPSGAVSPSVSPSVSSSVSLEASPTESSSTGHRQTLRAGEAWTVHEARRPVTTVQPSFAGLVRARVADFSSRALPISVGSGPLLA